MIKILHSADWHLDSPMQLHSEEASRSMRRKLLQIPEKVASLCKAKGCDLVLLSGDLFDGAYTAESMRLLKNALEEMAVPVFITPGNHDFIGSHSPWLTQLFPANVHIFTRQTVEYKDIPELNCRVYGAGYTSMDSQALLENFHADSPMQYNIGIFHGDPTQTGSSYCPITTEQVENSGLDYLALGHIHKGDSFRAGKTLCAWPGCPMGRGYDEQGDKGVLLVTVDKETKTEFVPLDNPRFYDLDVAPAALAGTLPPVGSDDFYRVTLVGDSEPLNLAELYAAYSQFPNLVLRDRTVPPVDVWSSADDDTFEGIYFNLLRKSLEGADEETQRKIQLAAKISRQLLDGQEVVLP